MIWYYLLHLLLLGFAIYSFHRAERNRFLQPFLLPALLLRLSCGVLVGWLYRFYYGGGDTFVFQADSLVLTDWGKTDFEGYLRLLLLNQLGSETPALSFDFQSYSNSFFLVKVLSLLNFATGGDYHLNGFYLSLFSFTGSWRLIQALAAVYPASRLAAIAAFLFFPSVVFWSSGVLKESILVGATGWLVSAVLLLTRGKESRLWLEALIMVAATYLIWRIKFFIGAVLLPVLIAYAVVQQTGRRLRFFRLRQGKAALFVVVLLLSGLLALQSHLFFREGQAFFLEQVVLNYTTILQKTSPDRPVIQYDDLQPVPGSLLRNAPQALGSAIYRPFFWETTEPAYVLASVENLLLLVLSAAALLGVLQKRSFRPDPFFLALLLYVVVLGVMMGLTTPNFGTLNRYRVAFLPFLVYLLLQTGFFYGLLRRAGGYRDKAVEL